MSDKWISTEQQKWRCHEFCSLQLPLLAFHRGGNAFFFLCSSGLFTVASVSQPSPVNIYHYLCSCNQKKKCCQKLEPLSLCNISNSGNASSYRMFSAQANWKIQTPPENNVFNEVVGERIISDFCVSCVWSRWALKRETVLWWNWSVILMLMQGRWQPCICMFLCRYACAGMRGRHGSR